MEKRNCKYPKCSGVITTKLGKYCKDACAILHVRDLNHEILKEVPGDRAHNMNEIDDRMLSKWT